MPNEQTRRHYCGDAGRDYHQHKRALPEQAVAWVAALRARKLAPLIRPEDVVFEYGVGSGWNLSALPCRRKIGYDVSDFLAPAIRALGIEFVTDTGVLPDAVADIVICHQTLEHVPHPPDVLEEIRRLLKPEGRLALYVPFERETRYRHFRPDEPNHHLYSWNVQTLGNLVQEAGFRVDKAGIGEFGYSRFSAVWAVKLRLGEPGFRALRRLLLFIQPAWEVRMVAIKPLAV